MVVLKCPIHYNTATKFLYKFNIYNHSDTDSKLLPVHKILVFNSPRTSSLTEIYLALLRNCSLN